MSDDTHRHDRGAAGPRPWLLAAALYAGLALAYCWPLVVAVGSALPSDIGDPGLIAWGLWWNAHAVPFTAHWWNAPMFYPVQGAFALSETFVGLAPLATPLQWAGLSAVGAHNVVYVFSFAAAALSAHALAHELTRRHDVALIAGLAFGFNPYRASQMPHLHLLASWWMPLALWALHRYVRTHRRRHLAVFAGCWVLNGLTSGYYLFFFAALVGLWMLWFARTRQEWIDIGVATGTASLAFVPMVIGYDHYQRGFGFMRGRGEIEEFSADLSAFFAVSPHAWLPFHWSVTARPEGELYPGLAIALLTIAGVIAAWKAGPARWSFRPGPRLVLAAGGCFVAAFAVWVTGGLQGEVAGVPLSMTHPHRLTGLAIWLLVASLAIEPRVRAGWRRRSIFLFYVLATAATLWFALGPVGRVFDVRFLDKGPYFWLMQLPGGASLRVPARFAMLFMLCLGQAAALALGRLKPRGVGPVMGATLAVAVLADGWVPRMQTVPAPTPLVLGTGDSATPVLELPTRSLYDDTTAMLHATGHGHPLVNGFSGFIPPHYGPLQLGLQSFDAGVVDALRELSPLIVIVNRANDVDGRALGFARGLAGARPQAASSVGPVFLLDRVTPAFPVAGVRVPIASVTASRNAPAAAAMMDGDLRTRWETDGLQRAGDTVTVRLDGARTVSRIEFDLADLAWAYPRSLRIDVVSDDGERRPVWEGSVAGAVLRGVLADHARATVRIDFAPMSGTGIVLTSLVDDTGASWAIPELRVQSTPTSESR